MNASLKCAACGLVQFVGEAGACARCGAPFGEARAVSVPPAALVMSSIAPRAGSIAPRAGSIAPRAGSIAPQAGSIAPQAGSIAPVQLTAASLGLEPRSGPNVAPEVNPWHRRIQLMALSGVMLVVVAVMLSFSYRAAMRYLYADVEGAAEPVQHVTSDGVFSVITPPSFVVHRSPGNHGPVVLELEDTRHGSFLMAMTLRKTLFGRVVSLGQVANAAREGLVGLDSFTLGRSSDIRLANHPAVEIPFDGKHGDEIARGLIYVIDGDGYYHVLFVGSALARFPASEPMLRAVVASARLHLH